MNSDKAATIIQRWFRKRLSRSQCPISHQAFVADYEIVLDKQAYNANELYINLKYSNQVPHTRRELTCEEIDTIRIKRNPFITNNCNHNQCILDKQRKPSKPSKPSRPSKPIILSLNKSSILDISSSERHI